MAFSAPRDAVARDKGNIVERGPCAVLRSGSVSDIRKMMRWCRRHGIFVASFGLGLTGFTNLSVAGTLAVGGVSGRNRAGAQVDHVQQLEVVTGEGELVRCSLDRERDLFEAMLGGMGQCGVMTRAWLDLVPAKPMARLCTPTYDVWLSESAIEQHSSAIVAELTPRDAGPLGFVLLFPLRRSALTRPFFRMPPDDGQPFVYLFDVLTTAAPGVVDATFTPDMLARNRRWFDDARAHGGTRPLSRGSVGCGA